MSDSASQKLAIATYFILSSPAGEVDEVLDDVRKLVADDTILSNERIEAILRDYNHEQMTAAIDPQSGKQALVNSFAHLSADSYYEPNSGKVLKFDHIRRLFAGEADGVQAPSYSPEQNALRTALNDAMNGYLSDSFKANKSLAAVYCNATGEFHIVVAAKNVNLANFWTGSWRSSYTLTPNGSSAELTGSVKAHVHYFEDGNVQLNSSTELKAPVTFDLNDPHATAKRIVDAIARFESDYQNELEEMYVNMHRTTFKAMRRILPINKQKFLWSIAAHSLAAEVSK